MQLNKNVLLIFVTSLSIFVISPSHIFAEEQNATATPQVTLTGKETANKIRELNQIRPTILKQQEEIKLKMEEQKRILQEQMQKKREEIIKEVENKVKTNRELYLASREAFLKKKQELRDENKKRILEKVDALIKEVNTKQTDQLSNILRKFSKILDEMATKAAEPKSAGADTTAFNSAMDAARKAIQEAEAAVASQAAKQYVITISSENALRENVGNTRSQLESDIRSSRESVKKAKDAVKDVARELAKIRREAKITISPAVITTP